MPTIKIIDGHPVYMIFFLVILLFLVWGIVGTIATQDPTVACDMGLNKVLCWKWHTMGAFEQVENTFLYH
jgi:hypothetical protein